MNHSFSNTRRLRLRAGVTVLAALALSPIASAHQFWIQPSAYTAAADSLINVELRVGDGVPGEIVPRNDSRIDKFIVVNGESEKPIVGRDGDKTAGAFRAEKNGLHILAYRSKHSFITLDAKKFEEYLKEDGLEEIIKVRKDRGESEKEGKEIYSRCAKSLVQFGEPSESQTDRAIGLRLELIAQKNPALLKPGDELPVQIVFDGKPAINRKIMAMNLEHAEDKITAQSDDKGMVKLKLAHSGAWLIASVLMTEAPKDNEHGAQWESLWASLTLQIAENKVE